MTLTELQALIADAKGPGRELDREVAKMAGWHRVEPRFTRGKYGAWIAPEDFKGTYSDGAPILDSLHGTDMHRDPPMFTASIDAALGLVERMLPEWFWTIKRYEDKFIAHLWNGKFGEECRESDLVNAPTAPLAILSALVAALIAKEDEDDPI